MAEAFIGMTVSVKLKPGSVRPSVTGKVINIHDQNLILEQVYIQETGETAPSWTVPSYQIADLEVVDSSIYQPQYPSGASTLPIRIAPTHTDPAILSYTRANDSLATPVAATPAKELPARELPADVGAAQLQSPHKVPGSDHSASPSKPPQARRNPRKAKGWRSTPLLEETADVAPETPPQVPAKLKKAANKRAKRTLQDQQNQNGWATEDATDVQDMGDFDFEANLSKFDKQAVFDQIRTEDNTADEDRLVSHNRLARPGTYGGKNLHPTENVLSPPIKTADEELDSPSETDLDLGNGRSSRQSGRSRMTRQGDRSLSGAGALEERSLSRALRNVPSHGRPLNASVISSTSLNRSTSSIRGHAHFSPSHHQFRIANSLHHCPVLDPDRLRRIEEDYARRPGLSQGTLLELTGRAIAESICSTISRTSLSGPSRRNSKSSAIGGQSNRDPKPVVVILAGNHAKGARAVAAARHLYGRGYKLLLSLTDFSTPSSWHPIFKTQVNLLQSLGRKAFARLDSWPSISAQIKKLSSPPALIVDALLDGVKYAAIEDVQVAFESREVVDWMNRSRARVLSLECPSGYDAVTGETTVLEGEPLAAKPDRVLALGGLIRGVSEAVGEGERWAVSVLDVGLMSAMRGEEMVRFEGAWSVDVEFGMGD